MNRTILVVVLASALLAGRVSAQTVPAERLSSVSDGDKLEKSAESLARMKAALKGLLGRVEEARNEKDVVKLNCVNEKLTQMKGLLRVAEQAEVALHEAVANKDPGADAEFSKIGITRTKIDGLRGEAEQCIGQLAYSVDERTTVEVQQPEGLPQRDLTDRRWHGSPMSAPPVVRPPVASRYY